jgi:hypothetical protein
MTGCLNKTKRFGRKALNVAAKYHSSETQFLETDLAALFASMEQRTSR